MKHPSLNPAFQEEVSLEEAFAGQMLTLLAAYNKEVRENQGGYHVIYPVTDRVDIMDGQRNISGSLRIKRVRSMAIASSGSSDIEAHSTLTLTQPEEDRYTVLALEYGEPEAYGESVIDDDKFNWAAYVLAIADYEIRDTLLVDGATGQELSGADLMEASYRLNFFAQQLGYLAHECMTGIRGEDGEEEDGPDLDLMIEAFPLPIGEHRTLENMYHEFDHEGTLTELYELHDCYLGCPLHIHPETIQN